MMPSLASRETRVIFDQRERTEMQAGGQRDAVDAGIERCRHANLERLFRGVHGQLFHAVYEDQTGTLLALHGTGDVQAGRFGDLAEVELDRRLVFVLGVVLVESQLFLDEFRLVTAVGDGLDHRVRDMPDAAQPGRLKSQIGRRNINAHAADHDRYKLMLAQPQAEIVHTLHCYPSEKQPDPMRYRSLG